MTNAIHAGPAGLPRLLHGLGSSGGPMPYDDHLRLHGALPQRPPAELIEMAEHSGLRGRGGADFPTAVKLRAVAGRRGRKAVVVNGSETEPASAKDQLLLSSLPHLVLDGAALAAGAVGAGEVVVVLNAPGRGVEAALLDAIASRPAKLPIRLVSGPGGYVAGEETAVVSLLNRGSGKPTLVPPRPAERGYRGRPTLIQNPETLAQLALVVRYGPSWFRELGTAADPGSALVTISGAVASPGVYELAFGTSMTDLIAATGGAVEPIQALLVGGYFGTWVRQPQAMRLGLSREELRAAGCTLGSGVVIALGESACGLSESARLIEYMASESAGQCGPCVHGLAAIAGSFRALADGVASDHEYERVLRWSEEIRGRGACHHPDGVARLLQSSLAAFGDEVEVHRRAGCRRLDAGLPLGRPRAVA
jgi:NADH:ubiquinone oxidoreductase subunit F (NADH-binding)